jgi:hypothetical protein
VSTSRLSARLTAAFNAYRHSPQGETYDCDGTYVCTCNGDGTCAFDCPDDRTEFVTEACRLAAAQEAFEARTTLDSSDFYDELRNMAAKGLVVIRIEYPVHAPEDARDDCNCATCLECKSIAFCDYCNEHDCWGNEAHAVDHFA